MGPAKKDLFDDNASSSSDSSSSSDDSSASSSSSSSTTPTKKKNITSITKKNESNNANNDGEDEDLRLTVNKKFATKYQNRKEREELIQIRQRKGGDDGRGGGGDSSESDSSDEEEDEVGELFTPSVNVQFLKTIKALRKKDDKIYDPNSRFFDDDNYNAVGDDKNDGDTEKKQKPKRYKDVVREQILEQMEDEENEGGNKKTNTNVDMSDDHRSKLGYDEQQNKLRKAFLTESSEKTDGGKSDDEDDEWMVVKKKVPEQDLNQLEKEASEELKEIEDLSKNNSNKKKGDNTFKDPRGEVEDGEKFLLDFIQNKKWIDTNHIDRGRYDDKYENENESGDESSLDDVDRADDYESQYNFRFEQATQGATTNSGANLSVQTYARGQTMNTVRRTDTTRKDKREARKERKVTERKAKEEQLKRLKNAKKSEMNQKLSKVKSVIGGIEENAIDEAQIMKMLEGDYDPEKFEKAMEEAYGDEFYQKEDNEWKTDVDVRETLKGDDDGENLVGQDDVNGGMYDNVQEEGEGEVNENAMEEEEYYDESAEWDDNNGDAYDGSHDETKLEKKLKTKMQDELYKLDYEDIVAGMPTRFKYRQVESNDYGLTTQEILYARDTTLKQFVSLKKMAPYNEQDEFNAGSKKRRKFREMLKKDLEADQPPPKEESLEDDAENNGEAAAEEVEEPKKKRRRLKKGKKRSKDDTLVPTSTDLTEKSEATKVDTKSNLNDEVDKSKETKKRRRKKSGKKGSTADKDTNEEGIVEKLDSNHKEADENKNKVTESDDWKGNVESTPACEEEKQKKKKKKKKKDKNNTKGSVAGMSKSRLASYGL